MHFLFDLDQFVEMDGEAEQPPAENENVEAAPKEEPVVESTKSEDAVPAPENPSTEVVKGSLIKLHQ